VPATSTAALIETASGIGGCAARQSAEFGEVTRGCRQLLGQLNASGPGHDNVAKERGVPVEVAPLGSPMAWASSSQTRMRWSPA
jgi:hypothetical protein